MGLPLRHMGAPYAMKIVGRMRVSSDEFYQKPLRVHEVLSDIPLHDVWALNLLGGGEGRTLRDFESLLSFEGMQRTNPVVSGLFKLRWRLGRWFRLDKEELEIPASSHVHRLTEDIHGQSLYEPGSVIGPNWPVRVVYAFENEVLYEVMNFTGHHFFLMAMEPAADGYIVYWAIYVKRTSWLTPLYMTLIDPFRRIFVYPAIIKKLEQAWIARYSHATDRPKQTPNLRIS